MRSIVKREGPHCVKETDIFLTCIYIKVNLLVVPTHPPPFQPIEEKAETIVKDREMARIHLIIILLVISSTSSSSSSLREQEEGHDQGTSRATASRILTVFGLCDCERVTWSITFLLAHRVPFFFSHQTTSSLAQWRLDYIL